MPEITSYGPISRHITEYLTTDKGVRQYKCKTLQNPDYYRSPDGLFLPVNVAAAKDTSTVGAGGIWLRDQSIVSFGCKQADDPYKLFGLRPDEEQNGSEQLEFSVESIEVNGKPQTINLRDRLAVSPITTQFGDNLYVQAARQRCRVMVGADNAVDGFKIALRLHLTGLTPIYRADLDEWWIFNERGEFRFRLGRPYLIDPDTMNPVQDAAGDFLPPLVKHSLTEVGKGEYLYVKEPTEVFGKVKLPERFLIDADTVYSTTADGYVSRTASDTTWAACHDATDGTACVTNGGSHSTAPSCYLSASKYAIYRGFTYYSLALLSGTVTACSEFVYSGTNHDNVVGALKGTQQDTLDTSDFDSFTGSAVASVTWVASQYNELVYNATGRNNVQALLGSTYKSCLRENNHDIANADSGSTAYYNGMYFADNIGTSKDPYLSITTVVTHTGTTSLDAMIQKAALTQSGSLDALLQAAKQSTVSLDAMLRATKTRALSLDALLQLTSSQTISLDSMLRAAKTGVLSLDALLQAIKAGTISLDALLQLTKSQTVSLGALLQAVKTGALDLDALLQIAGAQTLSLGALIRAAKSGSLGLDALIAVVGSQTACLDAIITTGGLLETISLDALLQLTGSKTVSLGALLQAAKAGELSLDALVQVAGSRSLSLGALLQAVESGSLDLDALIVASGAVTIGLDSLLEATLTGEISIDAMLVALGGEKNIALDALIAAVASGNLSLDAFIAIAGAQAAYYDACIAVSQDCIHAMDAFIVPAGYTIAWRHQVAAPERATVIAAARRVTDIVASERMTAITASKRMTEVTAPARVTTITYH